MQCKNDWDLNFDEEMSAKILVYNFVAGLFGTKGGFIFQGLNVSCETSVCCVTCDCSLYASAFSLFASKRVSLAEIVRLNLTQTQCRCFFYPFFSRILDLCAQSAYVSCLWLFVFFIYEKETCNSESWKEGDRGERKKSPDGCLWENKQIGYNERCECSSR